MRKYALLIAFALLGGVFLLKSQQPLVGSIQGIVKDQRGAPIPYADLTSTNIDSVDPESHRQTAATDKQGSYQFIDVPPGRYSITVRKAGYRDDTIPLVTVREGEAVRMPDNKMSPASK